MPSLVLFEELAFVDPEFVRPHAGMKSVYELNGGLWTVPDRPQEGSLLEKELFFALVVRVAQLGWDWGREKGTYQVRVPVPSKRGLELLVFTSLPGLSPGDGLGRAYCLARRGSQSPDRRLFG